MSQEISEQKKFEKLNAQYVEYIRKLKSKWLSENRDRSNDVYEVMNERQRAEIHDRISQWARYITPLAEDWWKERGYGVIWPEDNSEPMKLYLLEEGVAT